MSEYEGSVPPPAGVTPNFVLPTDVLYVINMVSNILCISLVTPFVLMRLYIKALVVPPFATEDWTCMFAWLLCIIYCSTGIKMGMSGGGYHQYEVTKSTLVGFQQAVYADSVSYGPTAYLTKCTLLLLFCRIFAPFRKTVIGIYIFMGAMICYYLPAMIIKAKICTPIAGLWDPDIPTSCLNERAVFIADTVMSAATDLAILILPIPLTLSLHMPMRKKIWIMVLLGAGGVATGASIVRLILVVQPGSLEDSTVSFVRFNLLGVAEIGIGLICACLPALNNLFSRYTKAKTSSSYASGGRHYYNKNSSSSSSSGDRSINDIKLGNLRSGSRKIASRAGPLGSNSIGSCSRKVQTNLVELECGSDQNILLSPKQTEQRELKSPIHGNVRSEVRDGIYWVPIELKIEEFHGFRRTIEVSRMVIRRT